MAYNQLIDDRLVGLLLDSMLDVPDLCRLPYFADHTPETCALYVSTMRRFAREVMWPAYRPMDQEPPRFVDGRVLVHPAMKALYPQLVELGVTAATRPTDVGGQQLPLSIATLAHAYLMAANLSAYAYVGLTTGAAHLVETFGTEAVRARFLERLYGGSWTGTMALTEPHAGSSLADITTRAEPLGDGRYRIRGSKIFISGGDHDITENIVNMTLARIDGAPPGTAGISLFAIPNRREEAGALVDNDVRVAGVIHKIGWRGLPSLALSFGDRDDCIGWLVGREHGGLRHMFQMMNDARIMVGLNAAATASAAYHEALAYARDRPQGRPIGAKDPSRPQVPIVEHADVRRMLLRQKSIVDGALALLVSTARYADYADHGDEDARDRARLLLDLLTPIAKSFPAEWGYEANALAVQVHGGYGYSSEYLPEAWLRDQKLNSIHEGTTGIQGLDLLGRRAIARGGAPLALLREEVARDAEAAAAAGVAPAWGEAVLSRLDAALGLTAELGARGLAGDVDGMMLHSHDYLTLMSIVVVGWQHLRLARAARVRLAANASDPDAAWLHGLGASAAYWIATELPRVDHLVTLCRQAEDSYARMQPEWF